MTDGGAITLTADELRVVARFALASAEEVLAIFESVAPEDQRPRAALEAARVFAEGAPRSRLQRVASIDAHRAAREVDDEAAAHAARAAGDAASAAYLHPLPQATQVGHILRASAHVARALELTAGDDPAVADEALARARHRATPVLREVLRRYPAAPTGRGRVAQLMASLDAALRAEDPARDTPGIQGWLTHGGQLAESTDRARRFIRQEFPQAQATFLGGSVATSQATRSSDLDLLIVLPEPWEEVAFVETSRYEGQLVETFVYGRAALPTWQERGRTERRPVLDRLAAEGVPLVNTPLSEEFQTRSRAVIDAGPGPADPGDVARRAYGLSALLDDLTDRGGTTAAAPGAPGSAVSDPAETSVLAWTLWREAAELDLLTDQRWLGTGKWLVRELRTAGDRHGLAAWAEDAADTDRLITIARKVLDEAGGYRQEGFLRGERPPGL